MVQPQDLTDIGGYGASSRTVPARDMKTVLQSALDRGYPLTLSETEINEWLGRTLIAKQGGLLAPKVSLNRVWVRLEDGRAEVVMERQIMGKPFTVSMYLKIDQTDGPKGLQTEVLLHGGSYHASLPKPFVGGRFGQLAVPQGFLKLVLPSYQKLADCFRDEIRLAFEEMARIKIEKGRLVLNPRDPAGDLSGLPATF